MADWIVTLVGALMVVGSIVAIVLLQKKSKECSREAIATIVDVSTYRGEDEKGKNKSATVYYPVYQYNVDGEEITITSTLGTRKSGKFQKGMQEKIWYNPEKPRQISTKASRLSEKKIYFCVLGVEILLIIVNIIMVFVGKK